MSGTRSVNIIEPGSTIPLVGRVLFLDPARDLAVISVPGLRVLPIEPGLAERGTHVAIIGYPGGGPLEIGAAVVSSEMLARGRDIYREQQITREIWVIEGRARPGNSGGPLVDAAGRYIGMVFAESVSAPDQAYALTAQEVTGAIAASEEIATPIETRDFPCTS